MTREEAKDLILNSVPKEWTMRKYNLEYNIDTIYDEFESRTCNNCKYYKRYNYNDMRCSLRVIECQAYENNYKDFGCNKFEIKDKTNG